MPQAQRLLHANAAAFCIWTASIASFTLYSTKGIDEVEAGQVQAMAQRLFRPERIAVTLFGRLNGVKLSRTRLVC